MTIKPYLRAAGPYLRAAGPYLRAAVGVLALAVASCVASSPNYLREKVANTGPIMLSRDNPYIVGNLFLSNELNLSTVMDGFVKHRGTPQAIEVTDKWLKPLRIYFFYLDRQEAYLFEEADADWVIRGPQRIPEEVMGRFSGAALASRNAPLERNRRSEPQAAEQPRREQADESAPALRRHPSSRKAAIDEENILQEEQEEQESAAALPPQRKNRTPRDSFDGETSQTEERGSALPSSKQNFSDTFPADIMHRVRYPRETLRLIAEWYTDSPTNAGRIARMNGIKNPNLLEMNQEIRIPGYLLQRTDPLPESEVQRYFEERVLPTTR